MNTNKIALLTCVIPSGPNETCFSCTAPDVSSFFKTDKWNIIYNLRHNFFMATVAKFHANMSHTEGYNIKTHSSLC